MYFNLLCRAKKDSEQENRKNNYTSTTYRYFFKENWTPNGNKYLHIGYRYLRQQYAKMHLYSLQDNNFNALLFVAFTKTSGLRTEIMKPARILSSVRWVPDYEKNEKNLFWFWVLCKKYPESNYQYTNLLNYLWGKNLNFNNHQSYYILESLT